MAGALKNYLGSLLGLLYLLGGVAYGGSFRALDAFDWTVVLSFMTLGAFFIVVSLLTMPAGEEEVAIILDASESLQQNQDSQTVHLSPNLDKEIETILETGQSTLLKISQLAEARKKQVIAT